MKTNILAAAALAGGLALAGTASAQIVGGAVGGTVGGAAGGVLGQTPGASAGASGGVTAGGSAQTPSVGVPSVGIPPTAPPPAAGSVLHGPLPLPGSTPGVTAPSASVNGQASANANANANVASAIAPVNLTGLATGMTVRDAKGRAVGKVSRIVKRADGTISAVEVAAADKAGRTMSMAPSSLNVASGAVIMSDAHAGASPQ